MFRHKGKTRTPLHNLRLASILSAVAGMVNVTGYLAIGQLTTNVTGHFAYFAEDLSHGNYYRAGILLLFVLSFLAGAFVSGWLTEFFSRRNDRFRYMVPVLLEGLILIALSLLPLFTAERWTYLIACLLLFAMGLQNALVTSVSNAIVRTTHLTGLFTDLGIELAQWSYYRLPDERKKLRTSIKLRVVIVACFMTGCITGGILFSHLHMKVLLLAAILLATALTYDTLRYQVLLLRRKYHHHR